MNIGEKLKLRRKKAGYTQERVAEMMNITRQTLSNWEIGKNYPDIDSIITLSRIYKLSLDELLLGKIFFKGVLEVKKKRSEDQIKKIIKNHFSSARNIKELHGGLVSQTFYFEEDNNHYVMQIGNREEIYKKEKWVYSFLKQTIPVRNVLHVGVMEDHVTAYSISEYIEGSKVFDLNSQELYDIASDLMRKLERLESVDVSNQQGYGRYDDKGHAAFPTWNDFIKAIFNKDIYNWGALESKGLDTEVVNKAMKEIDAYIGSITLEKKNLVHGDLGSFNVLAKDGKVTGVIDWSLSMYGDHLYDKANILFWNEDKLQPFIQKITKKYIVSSEIKERMYCYMLRIGLEEIYNTVILDEVGYDIEWVASRLKQITENFL
ncbi:phosphotransferase [Fictibacillus barbaricus]|uniref:Aminoglycoside phosphotransferase (APT) family kinase protein/DNA-binding XRE family transcriptional regulator n=1 Tax=Fictibacillus barbaricus TaxID=182136 RepID=A0ABU1U086_9BACL|nr:phosphotransferase [Fictibacillus barbaricus]MDR7072867.1 aminoglycoside phosphotransferase (APT) family kinase protein/DNA-binding XRE family transcriptional regulator [Fictibacillus barbaricus]